MSRINKTLYTLIALAPYQFEADDAVWQSDEEVASVIVPYVHANYETIVRELEEQYGISFSSIPPYTFDAHPRTEANAHYDHESNAIIFHLAAALEPNSLANVLTTLHITQRQIRQELHATTRHELGHDYFLERADVFGTRTYWTDFPIDSAGHPTPENYAKRNIGEGVAEYMSGTKREEGKFRYELVATILSINCKDGIDAIVQHPLLPEEWNNLPAYVSRVTSKMKAHEKQSSPVPYK